MCACLEEASFPSWQVNLSKGISESAAFALAELGELLCHEQLRGGLAPGDRTQTRKVKSSFQESPSCAGSLGFPCVRAAAQEDIPQLLRAAFPPHHVCGEVVSALGKAGAGHGGEDTSEA